MTNTVRSEDPHRAARLERERRIHDELAVGLSPELMPPVPPGELERAMLSEAQIGAGSRVLDLGCGSGDVTLSLLAVGAEVTALDLSPGMIEVARQRIIRFGGGRKAELVAAPVEETGLDSRSFDAIVGRFILHHLDVAHAAPEIARLLGPGGRAVFAENSARNRILMTARKHIAGRFGVPRLGTPDEHPLSSADLDALRPHFVAVTVSYPVFEFLRLFDRQVLRFRSPAGTRACRALDQAAARVSYLRRYSFRVMVTLSL